VILQAIADKLIADSLGVAGANLFIDSMPAQVVEGILVASKTPIQIHPYVEKYRKGQIQLIARGSSEDSVRSVLESVISALAVNGRETLGAVTFLRVWPAHDPLIYSRTDADIVEGSVNFDVVFIS
jgi:hypothetical protein